MHKTMHVTGNPHGAVANVLASNIIVNKFELQFPFRLITLGKVLTHLSFQLCVKWYH